MWEFPEFLGILPGGDQSSPGRVRRPRWVLKDLFRPKVSFQRLLFALASFSGFLVSLSSGLHSLWHIPTRHSPTWLFTPAHHGEVQNGLGGAMSTNIRS